MPDPIVCDCGGSTRIKRILPPPDFGNLPKLLDVGPLSSPLTGTGPLPTGATGSQEEIKAPTDPFKSMTVMFQDAKGVPFTIPVAFPKNFLIASNLGQNVRGDFVSDGAGNDLIITLFSTVADPLVVAKQLRLDTARAGRRRYVVENAGPIKTITLNDAGPPIFDARNPRAATVVGPAGGPAAPDPGLPLYVSVVVS